MSGESPLQMYTGGGFRSSSGSVGHSADSGAGGAIRAQSAKLIVRAHRKALLRVSANEPCSARNHVA